MTKKDFLSGARFKVVGFQASSFANWTYYYYRGSIIAKYANSDVVFHAQILAMDSTTVFIFFELLGQEFRRKIPFNTLELI